MPDPGINPTPSGPLQAMPQLAPIDPRIAGPNWGQNVGQDLAHGAETLGAGIGAYLSPQAQQARATLAGSIKTANAQHAMETQKALDALSIHDQTLDVQKAANAQAMAQANYDQRVAEHAAPADILDAKNDLDRATIDVQKKGVAVTNSKLSGELAQRQQIQGFLDQGMDPTTAISMGTFGTPTPPPGASQGAGAPQIQGPLSGASPLAGGQPLATPAGAMPQSGVAPTGGMVTVSPPGPLANAPALVPPPAAVATPPPAASPAGFWPSLMARAASVAPGGVLAGQPPLAGGAPPLANASPIGPVGVPPLAGATLGTGTAMGGYGLPTGFNAGDVARSMTAQMGGVKPTVDELQNRLQGISAFNTPQAQIEWATKLAEYAKLQGQTQEQVATALLKTTQAQDAAQGKPWRGQPDDYKWSGGISTNGDMVYVNAKNGEQKLIPVAGLYSKAGAALDARNWADTFKFGRNGGLNPAEYIDPETGEIDKEAYTTAVSKLSPTVTGQNGQTYVRDKDGTLKPVPKGNAGGGTFGVSGVTAPDAAAPAAAQAGIPQTAAQIFGP